MLFNNLREALDNRSEAEPTLYSALCVAEEVFKDYRIEACCERIGEVPVGDVKLPNMLIRLSNIIAEIYKTNQDSLTRNRAALENSMTDLTKITEELKQYSYVEGDKVQAERDLEELKKQLEEKKAANNLAADIARIKLTIKDLETVSGQIKLEWDKENNNLIGSVDAVTKKLNGVFQDMDHSRMLLNKTNVEVLRDISLANGQIQTTKETIEKKKKELVSLNETISNGNQKLEELIEQYNKMDEKLSSLKSFDLKCEELKGMISEADRRIRELSDAEQNVRCLEEENEERQRTIREYDARIKKADEEKRRLDKILTEDFCAKLESLNSKMERLEKIGNELANDSVLLYDKPFDFEEKIKSRLAECKNAVEQMRQAIKDDNNAFNIPGGKL